MLPATIDGIRAHFGNPTQITLLRMLVSVGSLHEKQCITAATCSASISGLVTLCSEKGNLRAVLRRASRRLISIDRSRHHEHRRVIVNVAGQFRPGSVRCPISIWSDVRCS